jgi:hypothetical protein
LSWLLKQAGAEILEPGKAIKPTVLEKKLFFPFSANKTLAFLQMIHKKILTNKY